MFVSNPASSSAVINGEKATLETPTFAQKRQRTLDMLIRSLYQDLMPDLHKVRLQSGAVTFCPVCSRMNLLFFFTIIIIICRPSCLLCLLLVTSVPGSDCSHCCSAVSTAAPQSASAYCTNTPTGYYCNADFLSRALSSHHFCS